MGNLRARGGHHFYEPWVRTVKTLRNTVLRTPRPASVLNRSLAGQVNRGEKKLKIKKYNPPSRKASDYAKATTDKSADKSSKLRNEDNFNDPQT